MPIQCKACRRLTVQNKKLLLDNDLWSQLGQNFGKTIHCQPCKTNLQIVQRQHPPQFNHPMLYDIIHILYFKEPYYLITIEEYQDRFKFPLRFYTDRREFIITMLRDLRDFDLDEFMEILDFEMELIKSVLSCKARSMNRFEDAYDRILESMVDNIQNDSDEEID